MWSTVSWACTGLGGSVPGDVLRFQIVFWLTSSANTSVLHVSSMKVRRCPTHDFACACLAVCWNACTSACRRHSSDWQNLPSVSSINGSNCQREVGCDWHFPGAGRASSRTVSSPGSSCSR